MENELKIFENEDFGKIRTTIVDGQVLFCGKDVASSLGYKDTKKAISQHCKKVGGVQSPTHKVLQKQ